MESVHLFCIPSMKVYITNVLPPFPITRLLRLAFLWSKVSKCYIVWNVTCDTVCTIIIILTLQPCDLLQTVYVKMYTRVYLQSILKGVFIFAELCSAYARWFTCIISHHLWPLIVHSSLNHCIHYNYEYIYIHF